MVHAFYKELQDRGALVYKDVIFIGASLLAHHINDEGNFVLDIITTPVQARNQGHATEVMDTLIDVSNKTNTPIELIVGVVRLSGVQLKSNIVGIHATMRKNKLPVKLLKDWYIKFGFQVCGKHGSRTKMIYNPKV